MTTLINIFPIMVVEVAAVIILILIVLFNQFIDKQEPLQEII